jgi:hypothetical protein
MLRGMLDRLGLDNRKVHTSPLQYRGLTATSTWLQPFLDASGAGLYANPPYHGYAAAFHILADYPGVDPSATWLNLRPTTPCGWQWEGTHTEFGVGVDRGWYDDWFRGTFGPGGNSLVGEDMLFLRDATAGNIYWTTATQGFRSLSLGEWTEYSKGGAIYVDVPSDTMNTILSEIAKGMATINFAPVLAELAKVEAAIAAVPPGTTVDFTQVLAAIASAKSSADNAAQSAATTQAAIKAGLKVTGTVTE